jgi:hypothetical protein
MLKKWMFCFVILALVACQNKLGDSTSSLDQNYAGIAKGGSGQQRRPYGKIHRPIASRMGSLNKLLNFSFLSPLVSLRFRFSPKLMKVKQTKINPKFAGAACGSGICMKDSTDIALAQLEGTLPDGFQPVKIEHELDLQPNQNLTMAGFCPEPKAPFGSHTSSTHFFSSSSKILNSFPFRTGETEAPPRRFHRPSGRCLGQGSAQLKTP